MGKYFIIDQSSNSLSKEDIDDIEQKKANSLLHLDKVKELKNEELLSEQDTLKYVYGRVIVKINTNLKNSHTFESGLKIRRERQYNEFNRRITQPTNAIVISCEYIPTGSEILISHNALHDSNRIFNYKGFKEISTDIRYYSIPEYECFAWRTDGGEFQPMKHFDFALKLFKPYEGKLQGLPHKEYENTLYVTTGELKGKVVQTLKGCDYTIIYQKDNGREGNIIRFRPFGNPIEKREEEAVAILNDLTDKVNSGELLVGINLKDCKKINEYELC